MNWRTLLPLALLVTGCSTLPNEVVPVREGVLRAPTYTQAADHCSAKGQTPRWLGKAPAEAGVLFQCY
ncbi:hypothetical protein LJR260_003804 [Variovorax paradoxus]|jgi:hypothetical protein|uniref:Starvation-inducible outer membrane lipoprotein n=1 Tax=Variovorax paradoxus TaxID=34073 RepID=A0AAW8EHZ2_VARPD|nr:hypothetical protein [Variovorax paradoxus]MBW8716802.1 hypothetical protein [Variovorax paradoxus]MDP9972575.1 starvation-inducible outer membrane lipoprotein [Variovorax paradoxus]